MPKRPAEIVPAPNDSIRLGKDGLLFAGHFQNPSFSRIDQISCFALRRDNTAYPFHGWNRRLQMKFSTIIHVGDGEARRLRRRCVKNFSLCRVIDVVQARSGCYRVGRSPAMADVDAHNVISTRDEEKASSVVQRQPLQLTAASIPLLDYLVSAQVESISGM
jgi:hypothetical protein